MIQHGKSCPSGQKHLAQVIAIHVPCTTLFSRITVQLSRGLVNLKPSPRCSDARRWKR